MRRETLIAALRRVTEDIEGAGISQMLDRGLETLRRESKDNVAWISFSVLQDYFIKASRYGSNEKYILDALQLADLSDPSFWQELLKDASGPKVYATQASVRFALRHLPRVVELLKQEHVEEAKSHPDLLPGELRGKELLTVMLVEDEGQYSSPERLIYALDAVNKLYTAYASMDGVSANDLIVLACDSGSDKSFDFLGLAQVVTQVRGLIMDIWDRRVFHKQAQMSSAIGLITQSLPVLEEIDRLTDAGTIEPERGEILKRMILDGSSRFIEAGAVIDQMDAEGALSPRLLMRPERKLLAAPVKHDSHSSDEVLADEDDSSEDVLGSLTSTELEEIRRVLMARKAAPRTRRRRMPEAGTETTHD